MGQSVRSLAAEAGIPAKAVQEGLAQDAAEAEPAPSAMAAAALAPERLAAEPEVPPAPKRRGRPPKAKG
jgi:hypothetical protein